MRDLTILAVSDDAAWLSLFWSVVRGFTGARLVIARSLEEAGELVDCTLPDMIAIDWSSGDRRWEEMDQLLWSNSILPRQATVLVTDEAYRDDTALELFRAGVDEYLSLLDHPRDLPRILGQWLGRPVAPAPTRAAADPGPVIRLPRVPSAIDEVAVATSA
ncbi:hypothetical protein OJF2_28980 [Aquisphaera giovannonii]|uniref:Response regulatory domain-containing protein n=1 Tax=Aquisphaera giovannonii TaxID=406548 RepID=A0A5B9W2Q6_9BACT|nr:hypothetical protein [Aquisphaera giovannonii]QEH34361.1 hypothetical protein OJF2_28980 [Aquisphaera giovannonii]